VISWPGESLARRSTLAARAEFALLASIALAGCGAGLESIHESNVRFEHCYRLDMDPEIAPSHRYHCWRDWTHTYAYGQSRDRIEYAHRRILTLEAGDTHIMTVHDAPRPRERVFSVVGGPAENEPAMASPAPTNAHKPPPATAPKHDGPTAAPQQSASATELPGAPCTGRCESPMKACLAACGSNNDDCAACREDYRACMRRCFE
jgi:hypothetical protein